MVSIGLLVIVFLVGIAIQSFLPAPARMFIDAFFGFIGGLIAGIAGNYIILALSLGFLTRILVGGYVMCIVLMIMYIGAGFLVGYYIF